MVGGFSFDSQSVSSESTKSQTAKRHCTSTHDLFAGMTGLSAAYLVIIAPAILIAAIIVTLAIMYLILGLAVFVRRARDGTLCRRRGRVSPITSALQEVRIEPIDASSSRQGSHKAHRIDVQPIDNNSPPPSSSSAADGSEKDKHMANQAAPREGTIPKPIRASNISTVSSSAKSSSASSKVTHIRVAPSPTSSRKATQGK